MTDCYDEEARDFCDACALNKVMGDGAAAEDTHRHGLIAARFRRIAIEAAEEMRDRAAQWLLQCGDGEAADAIRALPATVERLGRILSVEECDWLNANGFTVGWDKDDCEPQLNHIVRMWADGKQTCLCEAKTLWFFGGGWGDERFDGVKHEEDRRLWCARCCEVFDAVRTRTD